MTGPERAAKYHALLLEAVTGGSMMAWRLPGSWTTKDVR
jgi:hypothetical protein